MIENDNFHAFLNASERIIVEKVLQLLPQSEETIIFNKEFKEVLLNCFCNETKKNSYFFGVGDTPNTVSTEVVQKIVETISCWFDISTFCLCDDDNVEELLNVEKFKFSQYHYPLIIAYKCSADTIFKIQRIVGEYANIILMY